MTQLWTVDQAADYWGVTAARARGILSSRHIERVSGYPQADVLSVTLRRGARNDLAAPASALPLADIATAIAQAESERTRWRMFLEFRRGATEAGRAALALIQDEPPTTGELRYDALLAAAAEDVTARYGLPSPLWTITMERFLRSAWWVSDLPSARAYALVGTPAAFRRRGIYVDRYDITHDGETFMPEPLFDRDDIVAAFTDLANRLQRAGAVGQVHVIGGAAMLLAYDPDRASTRDIDAMFSPDTPVLNAVRDIARERRWPSTWLNNQASVYASRTPGEGPRVFDHPHLQVMATPADHLLAMKALAARATSDREDLEFLIDYMAIGTRDEVWAIVGRFFPDVSIPERSRRLVADLLER
ncbi:hypothetical protein [Mycolicibacterium llatzerense]|uniref:hypothetical protein n=1 Tax=Mycolicibacterium llatzerense TaxID=280871 RepID=UPI0021B545A3|nr:hypothetical protein [Mycolicibacterium llatzerense]MCT7372634.1 hypothetical protein [Mycolicibacterium llatzerense]